MEEEGLSLLDIWHIIMRKKLLVLILWAIIFLLFFILINFGINKSLTYYEAKVTYEWYGLENGMYANVKKFNYYDIISKNNMEKVKSSKEIYEDVPIEKLEKISHIEKKDNVYIITIDGNPFINEQIGLSFFNDLIRVPYDDFNQLDFNFDAYLKSYDQAIKISDKLNYLEKQINLLIDDYQKMIEYYTLTSLNDELEQIEVFYANKPINHYRYLAYKNTYMTEEEFGLSQSELYILETEKTALETKKKNLLKTIEALYNSSSNGASIDMALTGYTETIHSIDLRLNDLEQERVKISNAIAGEYNKEESQKFIEGLDEYKTALLKYTERYNDSVKKVFNDNASFNIININIKGRIPFLTNLLFSAFVSLLISLISGFIFGYHDFSKDQHEMRK